MAKTKTAARNDGSPATGEKQPPITRVAGEEIVAAAPQCALCALLRECRKKPNGRRSPRWPCHGLHIALVDGHEDARLAAQKLVQTQRDGWTLEVYHPSYPSCAPASPECPSRPICHEGNHSPASPPDVVLIGLSARQPSGLACVRRIKALAPNLPVLITSDDSDAASIVEGCAAGANGFLLEPFAPEELARALLSVAEGRPALCPEAQEVLLNAVHRLATAITIWVPGLSDREQDVAGCLISGWRHKEISTHLGMKDSTLHVHLTSIYHKLGVHSRRQAVAKLLGVGGEGD